MLSVFKSNIDDRTFIANKDNFEVVNLCDCYNQYGIQISCTDAGCSSRANIYHEDFFQSSPEEPDMHMKALAWTFWNGNNHNSLILSCENPSIEPDAVELRGEEKDRILKAYFELDKEMNGKFVKRETSNGIMFELNLSQGIPWDAEIIEA